MIIKQLTLPLYNPVITTCLWSLFTQNQTFPPDAFTRRHVFCVCRPFYLGPAAPYCSLRSCCCGETLGLIPRASLHSPLWEAKGCTGAFIAASECGHHTCAKPFENTARMKSCVHKHSRNLKKDWGGEHEGKMKTKGNEYIVIYYKRHITHTAKRAICRC